VSGAMCLSTKGCRHEMLKAVTCLGASAPGWLLVLTSHQRLALSAVLEGWSQASDAREEEINRS
jgi:hypothetical protein